MRDAAEGRAAAGVRRVRADRRAQSLDSLPAMFVVAALTTAVLGPLYLFLEGGRTGAVMATLCAVICVAAVTARVLLTRSRFRELLRARPHEASLVLAVVVSFVPFAELWLLERTATAGGVIVLLLAVGSLSNDRRYSAAVTVLFLAEWFVVAARNGFAGEWAPLSALVVCAAVVASVLNRIRCRTADRLTGAQQAVQTMAVTDDLTGLRNRRGLLAAAGDLAGAGAADDPQSVLFLDVDGLKRTNDRHGHAAGDRLVLATGAALSAATRPGDVLARLGGDEFAVLLPSTPASLAEVVAQRVRAVLADVGVAASVGVAHGRRSDGVDDLLVVADEAMYRAKEHRARVQEAHEAHEAQERDPRAPDVSHVPLPRGPDSGHGPGRGRPVAPRPAEATRDPLRPELLPVVTPPVDLRDLSRTGAWLHVAAVPAHLLLLPPGQGTTMAVVSLLLGTWFAVLHQSTTSGPTRRAAERCAAGLTCVALLVLSAETVLYSHLVQAPWAALAVLLPIVAIGGAVPSRLYASSACTATVVAWLLVNDQSRLGDTAPWYAVSVASAVAVGALLHVTHGWTMARLGAAQDRVRRAALTDELTGLPNRRGFLTVAGPQVEQALREGGPAAVLVLDLDGLKQTNDTGGHAAGDELIRTAAAAVRSAAGPRALSARYGGDEFTVLAPVGPERATALALRLEAALAGRGVHASIGVADLPADGTSLEDLVQRADERMFLVKRERRRARSGVAGPRTGC